MLQEKDYMLLEYMSQHPEGVKIDQATVPSSINRQFKFQGPMDRIKNPDFIWIRLNDLRTKRYVSELGAGIWKIEELGKVELQHYIDENADKIFAQQCDKVARYIINAEEDKLSSQKISDDLNIDIDTVEIIADEFKENEFVQIGITDGRYTIYPLSTLERFMKKTSFIKQLEKNQSVTEIRDSFNTTNNDIATYGSNSPVSNASSVVTQSINPQAKKPKWYMKILEEFGKNIGQYAFTAFVSFIAGAGCGKSCNQENILKQSQSTYSKGVDSSSYNKNVNVKDSFQKK